MGYAFPAGNNEQRYQIGSPTVRQHRPEHDQRRRWDHLNTTASTDDVVFGISSRGPSPAGRKEPDLTAPGGAIVGPTTKKKRSGPTSPGRRSCTEGLSSHVAGAMALLKGAGIGSPISQRALLINSARRWKISTRSAATSLLPRHGPADRLVPGRPALGWGALDLTTALAQGAATTSAVGPRGPGRLRSRDDARRREDDDGLRAALDLARLPGQRQLAGPVHAVEPRPRPEHLRRLQVPPPAAFDPPNTTSSILVSTRSIPTTRSSRPGRRARRRSPSRWRPPPRSTAPCGQAVRDRSAGDGPTPSSRAAGDEAHRRRPSPASAATVRSAGRTSSVSTELVIYSWRSPTPPARRSGLELAGRRRAGFRPHRPNTVSGWHARGRNAPRRRAAGRLRPPRTARTRAATIAGQGLGLGTPFRREAEVTLTSDSIAPGMGRARFRSCRGPTHGPDAVVRLLRLGRREAGSSAGFISAACSPILQLPVHYTAPAGRRPPLRGPGPRRGREPRRLAGVAELHRRHRRLRREALRQEAPALPGRARRRREGRARGAGQRPAEGEAERAAAAGQGEERSSRPAGGRLEGSGPSRPRGPSTARWRPRLNAGP